MNRLYFLFPAVISFFLAVPSTVFAGKVDDIQAKLNQSRQQTMEMLSEPDKTALEMRYEEALTFSKDVDTKLKSALADPSIQTQRPLLEEFKQVWTVFKATRDQEVVPLLMAGKQGEARALARKVQLPRFKHMNELLDAVRSK
jgi:Four helix bundle sensory module for signal transduction